MVAGVGPGRPRPVAPPREGGHAGPQPPPAPGAGHARHHPLLHNTGELLRAVGVEPGVTYGHRDLVYLRIHTRQVTAWKTSTMHTADQGCHHLINNALWARCTRVVVGGATWWLDCLVCVQQSKAWSGVQHGSGLPPLQQGRRSKNSAPCPPFAAGPGVKRGLVRGAAQQGLASSRPCKISAPCPPLARRAWCSTRTTVPPPTPPSPRCCGASCRPTRWTWSPCCIRSVAVGAHAVNTRHCREVQPLSMDGPRWTWSPRCTRRAVCACGRVCVPAWCACVVPGGWRWVLHIKHEAQP